MAVNRAAPSRDPSAAKCSSASTSASRSAITAWSGPRRSTSTKRPPPSTSTRPSTTARSSIFRRRLQGPRQPRRRPGLRLRVELGGRHGFRVAAAPGSSSTSRARSQPPPMILRTPRTRSIFRPSGSCHSPIRSTSRFPAGPSLFNVKQELIRGVTLQRDSPQFHQRHHRLGRGRRAPRFGVGLQHRRRYDLRPHPQYRRGRAHPI